jgi:malonyl-ACP O-methyltransferase BioC
MKRVENLKNLIEKNFSAAAKNYDEAAQIQRLAANNLCDLVAKNFDYENKKILDLGSGSSFIAKNISAQKKNCEIFEVDLAQAMLDLWACRPQNILAIKGDIENLSFKKNSFDLLISSFSLQWLSNFEKTFSDFFSILKPQGILAFSLPTAESLSELRRASIDSASNFNFYDLPEISHINSAFTQAGFVKKIHNSEILKQEFVNGVAALKALKKIGANYSPAKKRPITKEKLARFNSLCLKGGASENRNIAVSWHISYFYLQKS